METTLSGAGRPARRMLAGRVPARRVLTGLVIAVTAALAALSPAHSPAFAGTVSEDTALDVRWTGPGGAVLAERRLDRAALDALPQAEIRTETPWTTGPQTFAGPSLATLAGLAALPGHPVTDALVVAINDYSATIPATDWQARTVVLASRHNGQPMRVRENGPYWVVYPLSGEPALNTQAYHARMVWQVNAITFNCR